jgi:formyl-CoA transferase
MSDDNILEGVRVVELATMVFVPAASLMLADYGAEVIKVEPPGVGDFNRYGNRLPGMPVSDVPYTFVQDNRNKRSVAVDLKTKAGMEVMHRLLATADIFMSNVRPRALDELGLTFEALHELNPRLIYAIGSGYGEVGPDADKPGYDVVSYWARSGLSITLFPIDGWLGPIPFGSGDHPSSLGLFGGIMLALYRRQITGLGTKVSNSLIATGAWGNASTIAARLVDADFPEPWRRDEGPGIGAVFFKSSDLRPFQIGYADESKWEPVCRAIGRTDLIDDPRFATPELRKEHGPELIAEFDTVFEKKTMAEVKKMLTDGDIPHSFASDYDDVANDEQMAANNVFVELDQPNHGRLKMVNSPINLEGVAKVPPGAAPGLGEHTRDVLLEIGYEESELETLITQRVVAAGVPGPEQVG